MNNVFLDNGTNMPSMDQWMKEARLEADSEKCGMYLFHTGFVRSTPKNLVRNLGETNLSTVSGMDFSYNPEMAEKAVSKAKALPGIFHVRVWINKGRLMTGDPLMLVLVGGDIRPHVVSALESLVDDLKTNCVTETEF